MPEIELPELDMQMTCWIGSSQHQFEIYLMKLTGCNIHELSFFMMQPIELIYQMLARDKQTKCLQRQDDINIIEKNDKS